MMDLTTFTASLAEEFEFEEEGTTITPQTEYKSLESWSSMLALIIIAKINDEYQVLLSEDNLKESRTIQQLYSLVEAKKTT